MLYVGLDVHSRQSSPWILNASGGVVNRFGVKGPRSAVVQRLRQLDQPFGLCYEASCGYAANAASAPNAQRRSTKATIIDDLAQWAVSPPST